ncbi:hypothetical protein E1218_33735 [Kribbella turkmenica]|uniref:Uncharacterized protein n=1 Tax=Kribbella turkmenica TaxID=2530375 RepID=A0A4R4W7H9_9ACTN|nr:hypothetical protein [Kribbella turkmenica]TDD13981.1 hypothetical protein E1218_33735 [Kribbella turkmenica]
MPQAASLAIHGVTVFHRGRPTDRGEQVRDRCVRVVLRGSSGAECTTARWEYELSAVLAQQTHGLRRFPQVQDGQGLDLAVPFADPLFAQSEFGHGALHLDGRQVAGAGQLDAVRPDALKQPAVRRDHPGRGVRVDLDGIVQLRVFDHLLEVLSRSYGTESEGEFTRRSRKI